MITLQILSTEDIESIHKASFEVLEKTGIAIKNTSALDLLDNAGCTVEDQQVKFPSSLVEESIRKVPSTFDIYNREGDPKFRIGSRNVVFNPGSSAVYFKDRQTGHVRKGNQNDCVELIQLVEHLEHIQLQSTALIPSDVNETLSGIFRLYLVLKHSSKPIVTGAFRKEDVMNMKSLLVSVVGSSKELIQKPRAIFDCCPTSPLTWDDTATQHLLDCTTSGIPATLVPAPLIGATSPITIQGTLIQSNAEILGGVVISQLQNPGSRVIYGGAPGTFDMKYGTPRFSSVEAFLTACASSELGKHYGLPTHAYLGTSDSKIEDSQSGWETAVGAILGALSGINVISGPGMLAQLNCQSLEKLVIDNEICAASLRFSRGIELENIDAITELIGKVGPGGNYLGQKHTSTKLRSEHLMPSNLVDRLTGDTWINSGSKNTLDRAKEMVESILGQHSNKYPESLNDLEQTFEKIKEKYR
ncbi:MAG: trimethylamine methyltransferase family protein [Candidatus Thorarchaeota archaeon]